MQTLEREMLHQMPSRPRGVADDRSMAAGIRAAVKIMLTNDGVSVWPKPEKAPLVTPSPHMHIWQMPKLVR